MKVRAKRTGYYNHVRRRRGDVFTLAPYKKGDKEIGVDEQFSKRWMEKVDDSTPERTSTAQQSVRRQSEERKPSRPTGEREAI